MHLSQKTARGAKPRRDPRARLQYPEASEATVASSNLAIPAAIVLSSVILTTGLYLALRPPTSAPTAPASAPVAAPEGTAPRLEVTAPRLEVSTPEAPTPVVPTPEVSTPTLIALTPEIRARAAENARLALETVRAEMVRRCWTPPATKPPEPPRIPLVFNLSFSPQDQMTAFGISEDRAANRPAVAVCLRALELHLSIPAPGNTLLVEVPLTLP